MLNQLNEILDTKNFDDFTESLSKVISVLTEEEKQELLVIIMQYHYNNKLFNKFKKIFDIIIGSKLNLNFNINNWAPTFLSLTISEAPSIQLFDYFIRKGADVNFIGDSFAFENDQDIEHEGDSIYFGRYVTCLDFARIKLNDLLNTDYNFDLPEKKLDYNWSDLTQKDGNISISKMEYLNLHEQAEYLFDLVHTDRLKEYILAIGGKSYLEITSLKNTKM